MIVFKIFILQGKLFVLWLETRFYGNTQHMNTVINQYNFQYSYPYSNAPFHIFILQTTLFAPRASATSNIKLDASNDKWRYVMMSTFLQ